MRPAKNLAHIIPALESLDRVKADGQPVPWLATAWDVSPSGTSIKLRLRKDVKFHDGTEFKADVVKWNLERQVAARKIRGIASTDAFRFILVPIFPKIVLRLL